MNQTQNDETGLSAKMALCLAAITIVGIDGKFNEEELTKLRGFIHTDETEFLRAFGFYNEHSLDICIKVIAARLNEEQKQTVYRVLYELAHSDQDLAKSEESLLKQYATAFGLADNFLAWVKTKRDKNYNLVLFE